MRAAAARDVAHFGGATTRNVTYTIEDGGGSDDTVELVTIRFEYYQRNQRAWQQGHMRLLSSGDYWNRRSICGNLLYDPQPIGVYAA